MATLARDIRGTFVPDPDGRHGPLPPLLVGLPLVTGLVDSFSYLLLGHVFVANMTGNVVFLGFALAGAPGFSLAPSLAGLAGFLAGALAGGPLVRRWFDHRGLQLRNITAIELVLVVIAMVIIAVSATDQVAAAAVAVAALL